MANKIQQKHYDCLVDGHNSLWIQEKFEKLRKNEEPYAFILLNIKNFRYYNALHGIKGGNEILHNFYHGVLEKLGKQDYIAHLYADMFALLIHYDNIDTFAKDRLNPLYLDIIYRVDDERINRNIFTSAGVYFLRNHDHCFEDALNLCNIARLESVSLKNRTHSYEIYEKTYYDEYMSLLDLQTKTEDAYKNYVFVSYLQPKVDTCTHKIVGAEALLRWIDADGNEVPLYKFLPILNKNSYIRLVDLDVFELACKMIDRRIKEGKAIVPISFNISKSSFYASDIIENYMTIFNKFDIPKEFIIFELMESISLDDMDRMKEVIQKFSAEGFKCSLDDFGSGYSSFNVLLNADLHEVKLDRQFFMNNLNGDNREIISTVVHLIKSLNMRVVAEGVETLEYANFLKDCGCHMIQGYYFYRPLPMEAFEKVLDEGK